MAENKKLVTVDNLKHYSEKQDAVNSSKFVQMEVGDTLPSVDLYKGKLFFDTVTGRLAVYTGSEWAPLAFASDIVSA